MIVDVFKNNDSYGMLPRFENNPKVPRKLFDIALCYLKSAIKVLHDKMFKI